MIIHTDLEQNSEAWMAARCGIPTASEFSKLVTSKGEVSKSLRPYAIDLANELWAGKQIDPFMGNAWTDRGKEKEARARSLYEFAYDCDVEQVGFITDDARTCGCSPDGLIGEDGMLEIKSLKGQHHTAALLYYKKNKRPPTDYVAQLQGQMLIAERKWADLLFYHEDLPPITIRQTPDKKLQDALRDAVAQVNKERDEILAQLKEI